VLAIILLSISPAVIGFIRSRRAGAAGKA
jgi:hypothetical protein